MLSEFDNYVNLKFVKLGSIGHYCIEKSRFVKSRTWKQALNDTEGMADKTEQLATDAINSGEIYTLNTINGLSSSLEALDAKMELYCLQYELN